VKEGEQQAQGSIDWRIPATGDDGTSPDLEESLEAPTEDSSSDG